MTETDQDWSQYKKIFGRRWLGDWWYNDGAPLWELTASEYMENDKTV
jgi:hypothetical protein